MMKRFHRAGLILTALLASSCGTLGTGGDSLEETAAWISRDDKPFVVVGVEEAGQGVLISPRGLVLTASHVPIGIEKDEGEDDGKGEGKDAQKPPKPPKPKEPKAEKKGEAKPLMVCFRRRKLTSAPGVVHQHTQVYEDIDCGESYEERYPATVLRPKGNVRIAGKDLAVIRIDAKETFPYVPFYSRTRPRLRDGDTVHLYQYMFADEPANIFFIANPLKVIGVVDTPWGVQVLAYGYFRWGSSGAAVLKDGRLVGIQSNGYTINAESGEIALGYLSFELVWEDLVRDAIRDAGEPPPAR